MFLALLNGKTWAEAAWSATRQLSYVNTVVGDPLMVWHTLLAGDVTMDGVVDMADLTAIGAHWGSTVPSGGYGWYSGDLNGDGIVNVLDLAIMGDTWGQISSWAGCSGWQRVWRSGSGRMWLTFDEQSIPEPSSWILLAARIRLAFRISPIAAGRVAACFDRASQLRCLSVASRICDSL